MTEHSPAVIRMKEKRMERRMEEEKGVSECWASFLKNMLLDLIPSHSRCHVLQHLFSNSLQVLSY